VADSKVSDEVLARLISDNAKNRNAYAAVCDIKAACVFDDTVLALRELQQLRSQGWRDIATAPRDREIMVCGGTYWCDDDSTFSGDEYPFGGVAFVQWYYDGWRGDQLEGHDNYRYHKPTHWREKPLPFGGERADG